MMILAACEPRPHSPPSGSTNMHQSPKPFHGTVPDLRWGDTHDVRQGPCLGGEAGGGEGKGSETLV